MLLEGRHWIIRAVDLFDKTDVHDSFVREQEYYLFMKKIPEAKGRIFFLEDPQTDDAFVLIVQAPDFVSPTLKIAKGEVTVSCEDYPVEILPCRRGECEKVCRAWYRVRCNRRSLISMSNTWGDMNSRDRVFEDFVQREIDTAAELGVDIVQVDDGWQTLYPSDAARDELDRRIFPDPFWEPNLDRFPSGMAALTQYARDRGVQAGLWFAPDSSYGFVRKERDLAVLKKAYEEWGFRFFKLDMLSVFNKEECDTFLEMLDTIESFGPHAEVELDVTNGVRLGFLCGISHGILFVENRYAKRPNAFPHRVLRNLWRLSRYLPTCRLQMELINPDLAPEAYGDDPFAPMGYEMDYLFAVTMVSNPLFWMEMQFLLPHRREELKRILPIWKEHRSALARADISPIGQCPSGISFSGFCGVDGTDGYLVLFRETTADDTYTFALPAEFTDLQLLASNDVPEISPRGKEVTVKFTKQKSYVFLKGTLK